LAVAIAASILAAGGCGSDSEPVVAVPQAETEAEAKRKPILKLPDAGNATVQVRDDRRVELYDSPNGKVIGKARDETEWGSPTVFAVQRTKGRWAGVPTAEFENGRLAWVRLDPRRLRAGSVAAEIEVDLSDFNAKLIVSGEVKRSFTVAVGMPTAPTPTGRFAVTDTFRGDLNPAYGCCAVALTARQTRLPSGWFGGDRIAIHGTPGPVGGEISHGCVRARDPDVNELIETAPPGTPVTIRQ